MIKMTSCQGRQSEDMEAMQRGECAGGVRAVLGEKRGVRALRGAVRKANGANGLTASPAAWARMATIPDGGTALVAELASRKGVPLLELSLTNRVMSHL